MHSYSRPTSMPFRSTSGARRVLPRFHHEPLIPLVTLGRLGFSSFDEVEADVHRVVLAVVLTARSGRDRDDRRCTGQLDDLVRGGIAAGARGPARGDVREHEHRRTQLHVLGVEHVTSMYTLRAMWRIRSGRGGRNRQDAAGRQGLEAPNHAPDALPESTHVEVDEQAEVAIAGFEIRQNLCQMYGKLLLAGLQLHDKAAGYEKVEPRLSDRERFCM
jgi:hypothetical protein